MNVNGDVERNIYILSLVYVAEREKQLPYNNIIQYNNTV